MFITRKRYERELHSEFIKGYNVACAHNQVYYEAHIKPELKTLKADHWDKDRFDRLMGDMSLNVKKSLDSF